ncbi:MAG: IS1634 family transposase [bacterium]
MEDFYSLSGENPLFLMYDITSVYFEKDKLYRNLDKLYEHKELIEARLGEREKSLFNLDDTVYLYDLTSTYFEGEGLLNEQAKRGYSREGRSDCKQVVVGLVINRDGFPKAHEVFDGNKVDITTLDEMLDCIERRVGKKENRTVVVDRGMGDEKNIQCLKGRNYHYIVAGRQEGLEIYKRLRITPEIIKPIKRWSNAK